MLKSLSVASNELLTVTDGIFHEKVILKQISKLRFLSIARLDVQPRILKFEVDETKTVSNILSRIPFVHFNFLSNRRPTSMPSAHVSRISCRAHLDS